VQLPEHLPGASVAGSGLHLVQGATRDPLRQLRRLDGQSPACMNSVAPIHADRRRRGH
jgi:hypothetical protein